jgi:hypothetical protein
MLNFNNLDFLDPPDVDQTQFGSDMKRWLSNIVDICNANFTILSAVSSFLENLIATAGVNVGGTGVAYNIPVIGLTPSGFVTVDLISTTNPGTFNVVSVVPNSSFFTVTFNADPGAMSVMTYQAFITNPQ